MTNMRAKRFLGLAIAAALTLTGCSLNQMVKLAEEQELTVTPNPLELHGDSVQFEVSAVLPVKMLKKNKLYTIKTYFNYGDPTQQLQQFDFTDVEFPAQEVEQPNKTQSFSMFYTPDMESGELMIKGLASNLDKTKFKETPEMKIGDGVITTSRLGLSAFDVAYGFHGYNNQEELIPTRVEFSFLKGSSRLRSSELKGESGQELDAFIAAKNVTRTVTIYGSHSPEGLEAINSKLAEERAQVIKDFYFKKMKQYDYKGVADSIKFETVAVFQKWDDFKKELAAYADLTAEEKKAILDIINQSGVAFLDQEKQLSKLSSYSKLTKDIYPTLRTSTTQIMSVKEKKTDAEISILATAIVKGSLKADTLSVEELLYSATLTPSLEEKQNIYAVAVKQYGTWEAYNNYGATFLEQAKAIRDQDKKVALAEKAIAQLKLAANKEENAVVLNNLAACYLIKGDRLLASETYNKALSAPGSTNEVVEGINAGIGSLEIRTGNYTKAISALKKASEDNADAYYNLGLAYLLSKDYTSAEQALEVSISLDDKNAWAHYGRAIAGARQNKLDLLSTALTSAVAIDGKIRDKAIGDLEFMKFWQAPEFLEALK